MSAEVLDIDIIEVSDGAEMEDQSKIPNVKNRGGRPQDPIWHHFTPKSEASTTTKRKRAVCNHCEEELNGKPALLQKHITR